MKRKRQVSVTAEAATSVEIIWLDFDGYKHIRPLPFHGDYEVVCELLRDLFSLPDFRTLCAVTFHSETL
jgi:hypothetical protein